MQKELIKIIKDKVVLDKMLLSLNKEIYSSIKRIYNTLRRGGKVFLCGNGGSAADAQHLSAEFLIRLRPNVNRKPFPVISLALDTSTITACGNDLGYEKLFQRNLSALGTKKDLLIVLSTSGKSKNILKVLQYAKKNKIYSISLLGNKGGNAKKLSDLNIIIPSSNTARIQESHIFLGHFIFEQVENLLIKK
ncbi:SIS domain-containing protein [Candidatus Pelagibacter sp.]|nr:SIS domain-containing protein [Candidatus Pelagibacter sp.]|tara:strand:+ start:155 stop:730 length:576 start_codon:yes stop_codon:yes gene_type:complete